MYLTTPKVFIYAYIFGVWNNIEIDAVTIEKMNEKLTASEAVYCNWDETHK